MLESGKVFINFQSRGAVITAIVANTHIIHKLNNISFGVKTFPESNWSPSQKAESLLSSISSLEYFPEGSMSFFLSFALRSMAACRGLEGLGEQNVLFICLHLDVFCNLCAC